MGWQKNWKNISKYFGIRSRVCIIVRWGEFSKIQNKASLQENESPNINLKKLLRDIIAHSTRLTKA